MPWSRDDDRPQAFGHRRAKVCRDCRKIILRTDDLVERREGGAVVVLCSDCAAKGAGGAG